MRSWVEGHPDAHTQIQKNVEERLRVIYEKLWAPGDPKLFWDVFVLVLLGRIGLLTGYSIIYERCCFKTPSRPDARTLAALVVALCGLGYLRRLNRESTRVILLGPPDRVPCGYVHMLDLTAKQLSYSIDEMSECYSIKEHRLIYERFYDSVLSKAREISRKPQAEKVENGPLDMQQIYDEVDLRLRHLFRPFLPKLSKADRIKLQELAKDLPRIIWPENATQRMTLAVIGIVKEMEPDLKKLSESEVELLISMACGDPQRALEGLAATGWAKLSHETQGEVGKDAYKKEQKVIKAIQRQRPISRRTCGVSPEAVYSRYKELCEKVRAVREYSHPGSSHIVDAHRAAEALPHIPRELVDRIANSRKRIPSNLALDILSDELGVKFDTCSHDMKQGKRTADINECWKNYFEWKGCRFRSKPYMKALSNKLRKLLAVLNGQFPQ